ncbi:uncharacterized protein LAESUDRAFT_762503 [Laetiporus sulphureus 93-53]|uniref:Uncharacterized protein n=1 Tax=Laetiporus sulphureus 93-53 TaxID=1314785 RepID=A0A165CHY4_9APHY|nr:uncharacterized protein LAESUDRAFT_762503 [Laetiporus sulphureus 93-53]KZT02851.1 hypothetical protein LAESUDRAFT_762503 [Laetiporus sulphureus 93-53]
MFSFLLTVCLLYVSSVAAGLYGTRPIANTVLSAGRLSTVTWINDNTKPSLTEMGPVRIDLYYQDNYVATVADNVDPLSRHQKVWISPTWGPNGSDYHMRFICEDPPLTIYTADFTITAMDDTSPYGGSEHDAEVSSSSYATKTSASVYTATFSLGPLSISTTFESSSTGQSSTSPSLTSSSINTPVSTSTSPVMTQTENPYMDKAKTGASGSSIWRKTTVDLERIKFRLVFILWPVLIGVTMAL